MLSFKVLLCWRNISSCIDGLADHLESAPVPISWNAQCHLRGLALDSARTAVDARGARCERGRRCRLVSIGVLGCR